LALKMLNGIKPVIQILTRFYKKNPDLEKRNLEIGLNTFFFFKK